MDKQNFTVAEAANYLNVSETTLRELLKAKPPVLSTFGIGTKTMIPRMALDDFNDFQYREGGYEVSDD